MGIFLASNLTLTLETIRQVFCSNARGLQSMIILLYDFWLTTVWLSCINPDASILLGYDSSFVVNYTSKI